MKELTLGFDRLSGQEAITAILKSAVKKGEPAHAILFSGPPGSGKSTISLLLAQALNCQSRDTVPCEVCNTCQQVQKGNHPDVIVIEPEDRWIWIDQLREARKNFFYFSYGPGNRVCIIEDADKFTLPAAANLLKILEEPPDKLVFVLNTSHPSRLPATILSRCHHFPLRRVGEDETKNLLRKVKPDISDNELNLAVKLGEGIPGRCLDIILNSKWEERQERVKFLVEKLFYHDVNERELISEAKKWEERDDLPELLELLSRYIKDGLVWKLSGDAHMIVYEESSNFWQKVAVNAMVLKSCLEMIHNTRKMLLYNTNRLLALETLFLQIKGRIQ